jgi:predicted metal-dependent hydrolase
VLAHELYHIKAQAHDHGHEGVAKRALSGRELIENSLTFAGSDTARMVAGAGAQ